jgi:hypothetical protein
MASQAMRRQASPTLEVGDFESVRVGRLVMIDSEGRPFVTFSGGPITPVLARVGTTDLPPREDDLREHGVAVLLMFENGEPVRPIIVGFVREAFAAAQPAAVLSDASRPIELNGRTLVLEGQDVVVLRCGEGSLTIRANGQIVLKGTRVVSRASETNKIRGASVQIN